MSLLPQWSLKLPYLSKCFIPSKTCWRWSIATARWSTSSSVLLLISGNFIGNGISLVGWGGDDVMPDDENKSGDFRSKNANEESTGKSTSWARLERTVLGRGLSCSGLWWRDDGEGISLSTSDAALTAPLTFAVSQREEEAVCPSNNVQYWE